MIEYMKVSFCFERCPALELRGELQTRKAGIQELTVEEMPHANADDVGQAIAV